MKIIDRNFENMIIDKNFEGLVLEDNCYKLNGNIITYSNLEVKIPLIISGFIEVEGSIKADGSIESDGWINVPGVN